MIPPVSGKRKEMADRKNKPIDDECSNVKDQQELNAVGHTGGGAEVCVGSLLHGGSVDDF